ncbi:MAG: ferrochelatase [Sphingobacteriia bacterium]|nr:ferrochelatase [Sphingobacteriia bacterium]
MNKNISIILLNLGGPDSPKSVKPFLFNLFYDPAIIRLPKIFRWLIAKIISSKREKTAIEIYEKIGGSSPILQNTIRQAIKLNEKLNNNIFQINYNIEIAMRYWYPRAKEIVLKLKKTNPEFIILLPLYPQFSTTTTGSSVKELEKELEKNNLNIPIKKICCYYDHPKFIEAHVKLIKKYLENILTDHQQNDIRLLFSAHGLPERIIKEGDPYQWQVEESVKYIVSNLKIENLDYQICYQSRVGPLKWIGPSTEEEIKRAGKDKKVILLIPITFVSEHSETLVELDMEYKDLAKESEVPNYYRVPTLSEDDLFIEALQEIIFTVNEKNFIFPPERKCSAKYCGCINK